MVEVFYGEKLLKLSIAVPHPCIVLRSLLPGKFTTISKYVTALYSFELIDDMEIWGNSCQTLTLTFIAVFPNCFNLINLGFVLPIQAINADSYSSQI